MSSIELQNVSITYDRMRRSGFEIAHDWAQDLAAEGSARAQALEDVSLQVRDGEILCIVGPSGCGKSTLLRVIAGLLRPTTGEVLFDDTRVTDLDAKDRGVGLVFQDYALYPHMAAKADMTFSFRVRKRSHEEMEANLHRTVEILGVDVRDLLDRKPGSLSGGQKQRVALGRCMIKDPPVFLLDEPLSNLDAKLREQVRFELKQVHQLLQTTMVYVTHDQTEAVALGHRIAVMDAGRLIQLGPPRELLRRPSNTFVAGFLGSPPMNLLPCSIRDAGEGRELDFGAFVLPVTNRLDAVAGSYDGGRRPLLFGIRPEHLELRTDDSAGGPTDICGTVFAVERTMPQSVFRVDIGMDHELRAKADFSLPFNEGDRVVATVDMRRVVMFDRSTGEALTES